jgi:GH15 family glucan-1,4-alpha-glucosidase
MSDNGQLGVGDARDLARAGGLAAPHSAANRGAFPPIADYAFLSDCEVGALVAPSGNIEWMCAPQFDAPSVFGTILDRDAGRFRFGPADVTVPASRRYLPGSMVLETTWMTRTGWCAVYDFLAIGPWHHEEEREEKHRRAPADYEAEDCIVRIAACMQGVIDLNLECEPVFDYGQENADWEYTGPGYNQALATHGESPLKLALDTSMRIGFEGRRASARTTLREGQSAFVSVSWSSDRHGPQNSGDAYEWMHRTSTFWREWLSQGTLPDHRWRGYLERSAMTLKGLSFAPTGAVIAAPTTSLPREPGGGRNWDSRYTFLRDAAFTLWALYSLDFDWEADDFFYFLADQANEDGTLQNIYPVGGHKVTELDERALDWLGGYDGARPVRVGNAAYEYRQHDVWGAVLDAAYLHARSRDKLPERVWPIVRKQVEMAVENWGEPDRGIWALRDDERHYTSSKVMCWTACDRGARLAELRDDDKLAREWQKVADEIKEDVLANALDERGVFTMHYDTTELDASALLLPLVRFLPPDDYRIRNTVFAIADELVENGLVLRHRPAAGDPTGFVGEAFVTCSFWLVSAFAEIGEVDRARALCERLLSQASSLGLYAENLDPFSGRHLGNFPNAFTHLAQINAVLHMIRLDQEDPMSRVSSPHTS